MVAAGVYGKVSCRKVTLGLEVKCILKDFCFSISNVCNYCFIIYAFLCYLRSTDWPPMSFSDFSFLPLLSVLALDAIYGFGYRNGFLELMASSYRARRLSETTEPLQGNMTNTGFDELLGNLIVFYWPVINGNHPALSLQAFYFSGPILALWTVIQVESWRDSSRTRWLLSWVSHPTLSCTSCLQDNLMQSF